MKYLKLQQEILKAATERETKQKEFRYKWFELDEKIFIIHHSYSWIMGIPKELIFLNIDKAFSQDSLVNGVPFIQNSKSTKKAKNTNTIVVRGGKKLHQFEVDDRVVYVTDEIVKWFDLDTSRFTGTNEKSPIYIWENEKLVGAIWPVIVKGEE